MDQSISTLCISLEYMTFSRNWVVGSSDNLKDGMDLIMTSKLVLKTEGEIKKDIQYLTPK